MRDGEFLHRLRHTACLTLRDVSEATGFSTTKLCMVEQERVNLTADEFKSVREAIMDTSGRREEQLKAMNLFERRKKVFKNQGMSESRAEIAAMR